MIPPLVPEVRLIEPVTEEDFERYYAVRWRVLRAPWGQPRDSERDALEGTSFHIMACLEDRVPIGVGRLHFNATEEAQIRYMAVEEAYRRRGLGRLILRRLEDKAREGKASEVVLNARETCVGFYLGEGYRVVGSAHTLYGAIPHFKMIRTL